MTPKEWLEKNATLKDGASITEFEGLVKDLDPLKNITTPDQALDFMQRNDVFKRGLHKHETIAIEKHDKNFTESKLPGLLEAEREKALKEVNKPETPEQKELRELREKIAKQEDDQKVSTRKSALRDLASELKVDHKVAERYYIYGDEAEANLRADVEANQKAIDAAVEAAKKEIYGNNPPPETTKVDPNKVISTEAFDNMSPAEQMQAMQDGKVVQD